MDILNQIAFPLTIFLWPLGLMLIGLILLQGGAGDLASSFGGSQLDSQLGVGAGRKMSKLTAWLAGLFLVIITVLAIPRDDLIKAAGGPAALGSGKPAKTPEAPAMTTSGPGRNDVKPPEIPKPGEGVLKPGTPDGKPTDAKPTDAKPASIDTNPGDQGAAPKPDAPKPAEAKPAETGANAVEPAGNAPSVAKPAEAAPIPAPAVPAPVAPVAPPETATSVPPVAPVVAPTTPTPPETTPRKPSAPKLTEDK